MFKHLVQRIHELRQWLATAPVLIGPSGESQDPVPYVTVSAYSSTSLYRFLRRYTKPSDWIETAAGPALSYRAACRLNRRLSDRVGVRRAIAMRSRMPIPGSQPLPPPPSTPRTDNVDPAEPSLAAPADSTDPVESRDDFVPWPWVDERAIVKALASLSARESARQNQLSAMLKRRPRWLPITTLDHVEAVRSLAQRFPNFGEAIDLIVRHLVLRARLRHPLSLPALLLDGPPGIGKTRFVSELAKLLGFYWRAFSFAELTGGFMQTGLGSQWSSGSMGLIAKLVIETPDEQVPLLLADEVDKALTNNNYPTATSLIGMLEPLTAAAFTDEFIGVPFDIRPLSMLMTCNHLREVRPEIRSRMRPVSIPPPTQAQMPAIIRSVDAGVRDSLEGIGELFEPHDDEVIQAISALPPRDVAKLLADGYAGACEAHMSALGMMRLDPAHLGIGARGPDQGKASIAPVVQVDPEQVAMAARLLLWQPTSRH